MSPMHSIKRSRQKEWTLKNCYANKFSNIRFSLLQVCPSVPPLCLLCYLHVLKCFEPLFLCFTRINIGFWETAHLPRGFNKKLKEPVGLKKVTDCIEKRLTPLLIEGSVGVRPNKIPKFQCPKMRFPAFWELKWVQKIIYFWSILDQ